jgi:ParB-like chromosome segregation protein Spo0J
MEAIVASLSRFGQRTPIVVQRKGMVVRAGNGRLEAAKRLGWQHIAAVVVDDDSVEAVSYAIADNRTAELAEWDSETLASLLDTLPKEAMGVTGFSDEDLAGLLAELTPELGSEYTVKIESPIYEPKGIRPNIDELFNRAKTEALCKEIENASLPKPVADFLKYAAERHTVFDYAKIAEWYSHATESEQKMMQRSGLVIIDFDSAIENGFVEMTERIRALAASEEKESGQ